MFEHKNKRLNIYWCLWHFAMGRSKWILSNNQAPCSGNTPNIDQGHPHCVERCRCKNILATVANTHKCGENQRCELLGHTKKLKFLRMREIVRAVATHRSLCRRTRQTPLRVGLRAPSPGWIAVSGWGPKKAVKVAKVVSLAVERRDHRLHHLFFRPMGETGSTPA